MTNSQNGWPVLTSTQLTWFTSAGGRFAAANSDVAVVAGYLIERFNAEVEKIAGKVLDDWSFAPRKVRGSASVISNHASATAWDLNATKHPRGVKGTFSAAELAAVHHILSGIVDAGGHKIFRWGNDYVNATIDAMHFEINATKAQVKQARIRLDQLREEQDDMKWTDKVPLTAIDAKIWGTGFKEGSLVSFGAMVRYPTLARKTEQELAAFSAASAKRDAAMKAQLTALTAAVAALAAGSSSDVAKAFSDGVSTLQAEVTRIDTETAAAQAAATQDLPTEADDEPAAAVTPPPSNGVTDLTAAEQVPAGDRA
jgi:hypothetical protein